MKKIVVSPQSINKKIIAIILVTIVLVSISCFLNFYGYAPLEKKLTDDEEVKFDDRISPLTNQGLILEINRIRHRGLLDAMYTVSWRRKPVFYFVSIIDGQKFISKDVSLPGGIESESFFTTWDSMFQEHKVSRDVEEEQETSDVVLIIVERKRTLGLRGQDVEKEKIHVTYDYRTGRWAGDDCLYDSDGYGHYVGETFEVWFNLYQADFDGDGIPFWTEVNVLNTDPRTDDTFHDPDHDGVPTVWEWRWGYDPFVWDDHMHLDPDMDGLENIEEYRMRKWFADPFSQDIYVEIDGMERGGVFDPPHVLWEESRQIIVERFCRRRINVYFDGGWPGVNGGGDVLSHVDSLAYDSGMPLRFYNNYFSGERKGVFRYLIIGHHAGFCIPSRFNRFDTLVIGTAPYAFAKRGAFSPRACRIYAAAMVMHELGHSLGLMPFIFEGCDNLSFAKNRVYKEKFLKEWGNYRSVMNYYYIYKSKFDKDLLDFSDGSHGYNDQNDWARIYLPYFQIEDVVFLEPYLCPASKERVVEEDLELMLEGWRYSENLTYQYLQAEDVWSVGESVEYDLRVYLKINDSLSDRNLRLYARPSYVLGAPWTLIYEGYFDNGVIQFV
jgi:hypothetical protein